MPFLREFLQSLFGSGNNDHNNQRSDDQRYYRDRFRNPIWENDEEEDDEYENEYRNFGGNKQGFHFEIFTNPFEMTRYFESQMDSMMKDFVNFGFGQGSEMFDDQAVPQILPAPEQGPKSLRDGFLKPGYDVPSADSTEKVDVDLDGKVSARDLSRIWKDPNQDSSEDTQLVVPQNPQRQFNFHSFGKSIISQTVRRPDGTIEESKTVSDSRGNTETTVSRKFGDKIHTVITKRDKDGVETKTENFLNMDDQDLQRFENVWKPVIPPKVEPGILSQFPWQKLFGLDPKL